MIYTVTLNPSLDYIVAVDDFKLGYTNRTSSELMLPGGKGTNVSIVLKNLGIDSTALGFVAGFTGDEIVRELEETGINTDFIKMKDGISRINLKLSSIDGTEINGQGPDIPKEQLDKLMERLMLLGEGDILVLAGSIPVTMPSDIYEQDIKGKFPYTIKDTFMGFHCGNTPECKMCESRAVKYQLIQHRLLEPAGSEPDFTRGTLEGDIAASDITFYRLQCNSEGELVSYVAEGEVLDVPTRSFGGIGIFAIKEMGRFYRHVLIEGNYPHHGAVMFGHYGKAFYEVVKFLGLDVKKIGYNQPAGVRYPTENPWG